MIELHDISIANDSARPLISSQSLTIASGNLTALIGRNGCGKSTLLRVLSGAQRATCGRVIINNLDVARASARELALTIAVITTESVRVENLTCRQLVSYGRSPHTGLLGRLTPADEAIVGNALEAVGMTEFADRRVSRISDGEGRRIMLARALAQKTPVILLDEPTSFLDVPGRYEIAALLGRLAREQGKTILYSTHELEPAFREADNILLMRPEGLLLLPPDEMRLSAEFKRAFAQEFGR